MSQAYRNGAIKRTKWALIALVFIFTQITQVIQFSPHAKAADTGYKTPGTTHAPNNWDTSAVANIQSSNDVYVSENDGSEQGYAGFNFAAIPTGSTINGVLANVEAKSTDTSGCRVGLSLSWNDGNNYAVAKYSSLTGSDTSSTLGGTNDTWGRTWSVSDFTDTNFVAKIQDNDPGNDCDDSAVTSVDYLEIKVFYTAPVAPVANPSLGLACGLDIALVIDNSSSIDTTELTQMKAALTAFTNALAGTPTQFSVTKFNTSATVLQNFTGNVSTVNTAINAVPQIPLNPNPGYTNWEDGLLKANGTFPNRAGNPDLVIFATDGDPTTSNTVGGIDTNQPNAHLTPAVTVANTIKNGGKRILAIGIGLGSDSLPRLEAISGPNDNTGDVLTSDVITSNFSALAGDLAEFAEQTCGATITTTKLIDADGNPQTTNDQTPASNWQFDINGGSDPAATTTDNYGKTPAVTVTPGSGYSVNETVQPGYKLLSAQCTGATNNGSKTGNAVTGIQVAASNIVSCTFINTRTTGSITVQKVVNNTHGGTKQPNNFSFTLNGQTYPFEADGSNSVTVPTDSYTITEVNPNTDGYTTSYTNCANVIVTETNAQTCVITNSDIAPQITLNKTVEGPTYGVTPNLNGFGLTIDGTAVTNGGTKQVQAGQAVALNEQGADGYEFVRIEGNAKCPSALNGTVTLGLGESITCIIVNKAKAPSINVVKKAINDNGGTTLSSAFNLYANGTKLTGGTTQTNTTTSTTSYTVPNVQANVGYHLSEDTQTNYNATAWVCSGNGTQQGNTIAVGLGKSATCTIENNDIPPVLTLIKSLNPELWGSGATGADFTLNATKVGDSVPKVSGTDNNASDQTSTITSDNTFQAGTYTLGESSSKWAENQYVGDWSCLVNNMQVTPQNRQVTLGIGDTASCMILNTMKPAKLTVVKEVVNDNGGEAVVGDFDITLSSKGELSFGTPQVNGSKSTYTTETYNLNAGNYTLSELKTNGYTEGTWSCGTDGSTGTLVQTSLNLKNGDTVTCTITNNDIAPNLTLVKYAPNNNGGTLDPLQVALFASGPSPSTTATQFTSGIAKNMTAGSYTVSETPVSGYQPSDWSGDCAANGTLTMVIGGNYTCSITNDDLANTLTVKKVVINDNGGTATADDFSFSVNGAGAIQFIPTQSDAYKGENTLSVDANTYTITEPNVPAGYEVSYEGCTNIVLTIGQSATCTITNNDKPGTLNVIKRITNDNGGGKTFANFSYTINSGSVIPFDTDGSNSHTVSAGTYSVKETVDSGYKATYDNCTNIIIPNGGTATCTIKNDDISPVLIIHKNADPDTDIDFEFDITPYCTCDTVRAEGSNGSDCACGGSKKQTVYVPANDSTTVTSLNAGQYRINEDTPDGWQLIDNMYCTAGNPIYNDDNVVVTLEIGKTYDCYFTNKKLSTVHVTKYWDKNQNGVRDEYFNQGLEPTLAGFTFYLHTDKNGTVESEPTDENGVTTFSNVPSGFYWIEEQDSDGWWLTNLSCEGDQSPKDERSSESEDTPDNDGMFYVNPGNTAHCTAGNASTTHYYNIAKTNNATTIKRVGDIVIYTITLTMPNDTGVLYNPLVGDAPPTGFTYLNGSWTATSNLRGNLKPGVSVEPTYASPGLWRFNGFATYYNEDETVPNNAFYPGEIITLTYETKIQNDVSAGTYPDLALSLAFATDDPSQQNRDTAIVANVTNQGGTTPFVGTDVTVAVDPPTAQVVLVNTGSGAIWALIMGTSLVVISLATRRLVASERRMK